MLGAIVLVLVIAVVMPVAICMSGAAVAALLGFFLKSDAEVRNEGSELIALNK